MADHLTPSSNDPGDSTPLISWLPEVAALRQTAGSRACLRFPNAITASADGFYREATEAPVPLDLRVLRALRSPFEIDIYVWLTWRFFRLRKPVTIPWASLALQFGSGYANPRHFKKRFLGYLKSVVDYYSEVRLESSATGLLLRPSPTHVKQRLSKR